MPSNRFEEDLAHLAQFTLELARGVHRREPTCSELVSVRRALAALMRDDAVRHLGFSRYWAQGLSTLAGFGLEAL